MREFFIELRKRNNLLFLFGFINLILAIIFIFVWAFDKSIILGENAFLKPIRYFVTSGIFAFTIGWITYYINVKSFKTLTNWLFIISVVIENTIILLQAYRGVPSHFNVSDPFNKLMYGLMVFSFAIFVFTIGLITIKLFTQKKMPISQHFTWGLRMGFLVFMLCSSIGIYMLKIMSHTIGGTDGGPGLFFFNWSTKFGDLRVAHFLGMISIVVIPLVSYYFHTKKNQVILFSICYLLAVLLIFILAMMKLPLIPM
jgi:hypothetical protein